MPISGQYKLAKPTFLTIKSHTYNTIALIPSDNSKRIKKSFYKFSLKLQTVIFAFTESILYAIVEDDDAETPKGNIEITHSISKAAEDLTFNKHDLVSAFSTTK